FLNAAMLPTLIAILASSSVAAKTCSPLKNRDIFSTVEVEVGTPSQRFELVADTGSNTLIVQSCVCQELGSCPSSFGRCFRGNATSTFSIARSQNGDGDPHVWILKYGSGDIEALVTTDFVSVGSYTARMNSSLLLMVSQSLNFDASFEGILGLGVPNVTAKIGPAGGTHRQPEVLTSFLDGARVNHFSLCFNSGNDGVLALDYETAAKPLASTSREHWQLKLLGASVAGHQISMGQDTAKHSAIPDSGTTLITGPQEQIAALLESICEKWPRCKTAREELNIAMVQTLSKTASKGGVASRSKTRLLDAYARWHESSAGAFAQANASFTGSGAFALQMLMEDCSSWKTGVHLNAEMPTIKLHLEGADGTNQDVQLLPSSYVAEVTANAMVWTQKYLLGILPYWWPELEEDSSCATLLGSAEYVGHQVWILGTPLFYNRRVHFDLGSPPSVGFSDEPCGSCVSGEYQNDISLAQSHSAGMRQLRHPGRVPWPKTSESY
ncbi:unnamed protein product, partial [Cladocopium goreaui]